MKYYTGEIIEYIEVRHHVGVWAPSEAQANEWFRDRRWEHVEVEQSEIIWENAGEYISHRVDGKDWEPLCEGYETE